MKACREYRRWVNRMRRKFKPKNGVIPAALFDAPKKERLVYNSKRAIREAIQAD